VRQHIVGQRGVPDGDIVERTTKRVPGSATVSSAAASELLKVMPTFAPARAQAKAMALPTRAAPPVTITVSFSSEIVIGFS